MTTYEPTTWVKGETVKVARTVRQAVALKFEGYRQTEAPVAEAQPVADLEQGDSTEVAVPFDEDGHVGRWDNDGGHQ